MGVFDAVEQEVKALGPKAEGSVMAESALSMARELDDDGNSATSKSMCAKALIDVMRELRSLAPAKKEQDDLSDLRERREQRRSRSAATADSARP